MEGTNEQRITKYVEDMSSPVWLVSTTHTGNGGFDYERAGMFHLIASGSFTFKSGTVFRVYQSAWKMMKVGPVDHEEAAVLV